MKKCRYFQSSFFSMTDLFFNHKGVNAHWDNDRNTDTMIEVSVAPGQSPLLYSVS